MICYKDKTFCTFHKECKEGKECGRALTPEVKRVAREWWGNEKAPIAMFSEKPNCFKNKRTESDNKSMV